MTLRQWTTVRVRAMTDRAPVITALFEAGAEAIQELDNEIVSHLAQPNEAVLAAAIKRADTHALTTFEPTPDVDWSAEWRSRIGAHRLGTLVVTPPWLGDRFSADERVVIEPAMAFGTGEHETTRGVIRLLHSVIRPDDTVADLGTGSAILAIAAAKLGANRVVAIEVDPDAITNAEDNVERNGVRERVTVIEGDARLLLPLVAPVRVVLANIIATVLIELLPVIADALTPDGEAILSGMLLDEQPSIEASLRESGWRVTRTDQEGIWWSVAIARA